MTIIVKHVELTSDTSGDATGTIPRCNGTLRSIIVKNSTTAQPTDQWDLTVAVDGITIFSDNGIGNAANELHIPTQVGSNDTSEGKLYPLAGTVTITGANMGSTKKARVLLQIDF